MEKKDIVSVCAWCPDKKEKTQEAMQQGKEVTHGICKDCQEVQEKAFQILISKR